MKYYYTIAALPDLPGYRSVLEPDEITGALELIERNLEPGDGRIFRYLRYPVDHSNIICAIIEECHGIDLPHNPMSVFPVDLIRNFRNHKDQLPDYMRTFIIEHEDRLSEYTIQTLEESLYSLFMNEMESNTNEFVRSYFHFDHQLRSIAAVINARVFGTDAHSELIDPRLSRMLGKTGDQDALMEFPYLEKLSEALNSRHPDKIIDRVDRIKWTYIDDQVATAPFSLDHLLGYYLKLMIVKRRSELQQAEARKSINVILNESLQNYETI
ncbi:MAG: DUF2764 family protein [Cyclobacteriaceae bacterium]